MRLGQTIINIRKERNMTQEEFAQIFHVTRQTVSNWEKEKNYPDIETLVSISEQFNISLDAMLKEDKQMVKKLNMDIKFSQRFKKNAFKVLAGCAVVLALSAAGWGIVWNHTKKSLDAKFAQGIDTNNFYFDGKLGFYKKTVDQNSYYTLPNQTMPDYFNFSLHYHNTTLDYYSVEDEYSIQIRWSGKDSDGTLRYVIAIHTDDEEGNFVNHLSEKEKEEFRKENPSIDNTLKEGEKIYNSVYQ